MYDQSLMDRLKQVRSRYETKIRLLQEQNRQIMAEHNKSTGNKTKEIAGDDWAAGQATNENKSTNGKPDENGNKTANENWGTNGWGTTVNKSASDKTEKNVNNDTTEDWGTNDWGTTADKSVDDKPEENINNNTTEDWGTNEEKSTKGSKSKKKSKEKPTKENDTNTAADDWGTTEDKSNKNAKSKKKIKEKTSKENEQQSESPQQKESDQQTEKEPHTENDKSKESIANSNPPDTPLGNQSVSELRDKYLTAKLDIRLHEIEKKKLQEELDRIKIERDSIINKLADKRQEHEAMAMKVRQLTIDLISSNEEAAALHHKVDSLEHELVKTKRELKEKMEHYESEMKRAHMLIKNLREGCQLVESQAKNFEDRHDTVRMSKAELERDLLAIKEEASRHITKITKLESANMKLNAALEKSVRQNEKLCNEYTAKIAMLELQLHTEKEQSQQLKNLAFHLTSSR